MTPSPALAVVVLSACSVATPPASEVGSTGTTGASGEPRLVATGRVGAVQASDACFVLTNVRLPGGEPTQIHVRWGRIAAIEDATDDAVRVDGGGAFVVPAAIDAHVHLAYLPVEREDAEGGIAGAVDLASPVSFLDAEPAFVRLRRAGPMITAPAGYPTTSWGAGGYGRTCADAAACADAVRELSAQGADLIKVAVTEEPTLDDVALASVVATAHERGLRVAAHALSESAVQRAADAGIDILAHTPTAPLSDETVARMSGAVVISTLGAFGRSATAVDNLARLRRAGATVVYGTDLGNTRAPGIDARELALLRAAGLDEQAILDAMSHVPAEVFGFDELGSLDIGKDASFLLLAEDPLVDIGTLAAPQAVYLAGRRM